MSRTACHATPAQDSFQQIVKPSLCGDLRILSFTNQAFDTKGFGFQATRESPLLTYLAKRGKQIHIAVIAPETEPKRFLALPNIWPRRLPLVSSAPPNSPRVMRHGAGVRSIYKITSSKI
jgi:hypothetical protein